MFTENFLAQLAPFNPKFNEPLAKYTTWQIGGPAEILVKVKSSEELQQWF
jgi:UDP-N-acetylenolpyruvoylglucosamine reductase